MSPLRIYSLALFTAFKYPFLVKLEVKFRLLRNPLAVIASPAAGGTKQSPPRIMDLRGFIFTKAKRRIHCLNLSLALFLAAKADLPGKPLEKTANFFSQWS